MTKRFLMPANAIEQLYAGAFDLRMEQMYGVSGIALQPYRDRIASALVMFEKRFGNLPVRVFSVSGRTELGGNHTDHQNGRVLCGAISQDIIAVAAVTEDRIIRAHSEGFSEETVDLTDLSPRESESGRSAALIRGTAERFSELGKPVGGFCAYIVSAVPKGSGLSSSAAFEVLLGTICNEFYADSTFSPVELAQIAQYAENRHFGKPCGLMDQMACALGGVTAIDFENPAAPDFISVPLNPAEHGFALCIIDTGANHADLTEEYGAIPSEMKAVAGLLGGNTLRETNEADFWAKLPVLRRQCGDRAVMRAIHFYNENARVLEQVKALAENDFAVYLRLVQESGESSVFALQNIYASGASESQSVAVAIAVCQHLLNGEGACRVHGGGFAGTVQAYVPLKRVDAFLQAVDSVFGTGAGRVLQIRTCGACALWYEDELCF